MGKLVFLDIDGTLMEAGRLIRESTKSALKQAQSRGHKLFICTGRHSDNLPEEILQLGLDGVVASTGAQVLIGEQEIFHQVMEREKLKIMIGLLREYHAAFYFMGKEGLYIGRKEYESLMQIFAQKKIETRLKFQLHEDLPELPSLEACDYYQADIPVQELNRIAAERTDGYFKVTGASFGDDQVYCGEVTMSGISKGTGMAEVVRYYGMAKEDTIGIGDGMNDFDMLKYAHIGIAMGNAVEGLKQIADYVTRPIQEDGILHAFRTYGLLD